MARPIEVGMFESKAKLSELVQRVLGGERFYITRRGKRVALLGPVEDEKRPLARGSAKNPGYRMSEDFTSSIDDFEEYT